MIADLAITNLTISLRAIANLKYGTTLRCTREIYTSYGPPSSAKLAYSNRGRRESHARVRHGSAVKYPDTLVLDDVSVDRGDLSNAKNRSPGSFLPAELTVNLKGATD